MAEDPRRGKVTEEHRDEARRLRAIWDRTKEARQAAGVGSQEAFGAKYGIGNQAAVGFFLNGKTALSLKAAMGFAAGLGCEVADFSPRLNQAAAIEEVAQAMWQRRGLVTLPTGAGKTKTMMTVVRGLTLDPNGVLDDLEALLLRVPPELRRAFADNLAGWVMENGAKHRRDIMLSLLRDPPSTWEEYPTRIAGGEPPKPTPAPGPEVVALTPPPSKGVRQVPSPLSSPRRTAAVKKVGED